MKAGCPSDLALEELLLDRASSPVAPHVAGCEDCTARLAEMAEQGQVFRTVIRPATVDRILEAAPSQRSWWTSWFTVTLAAPAAALAVVVLMMRNQPVDAPTTQLKGGARASPALAAPRDPLSLSVFTANATAAVSDGAEVPAASALRFQLAAPAPCFPAIVSVDDKGELSHLVPAATAAVAPGTPLPGGAVLDGLPGVERLFAVCAPRPLSQDDVDRAVKSALAGQHPDEKAPRLQGLPEGALQTSLLLRKRP